MTTLGNEGARVEWLNGLPHEEAREHFLACGGAARWAEAMTLGRPFADTEAALAMSDAIWERLGEADMLEALSMHPSFDDARLERMRIREDAAADLAFVEAAEAQRELARRRLAELFL